MTDTNQRKLGSTLWGIAGCLTSLGDLIATQTQKLNALKTHKKGLMQQLFPVFDELTA
jgi:type I restriction enzyme S subunit